MPPENVRRSKLHSDWSRAMRAVWHHHPTLTFFISQDNDIVALGGWKLPAERYSNDNSFTVPPLR